MPRTVHVRDRVVQEVWDTEIPDEHTVKSILEVVCPKKKKRTDNT